MFTIFFISNFEFNICVDKKHRAHYTWYLAD